MLPLNQTLASLGYTTQPAHPYCKHILRDSTIVFTGDSVEVWAWLRATKQIAG